MKNIKTFDTGQQEGLWPRHMIRTKGGNCVAGLIRAGEAIPTSHPGYSLIKKAETNL